MKQYRVPGTRSDTVTSVLPLTLVNTVNSRSPRSFLRLSSQHRSLGSVCILFLLRYKLRVMLSSVRDTSVGRCNFSRGCLARRSASRFSAVEAAYRAASFRICSRCSKSSSSERPWPLPWRRVRSFCDPPPPPNHPPPPRSAPPGGGPRVKKSLRSPNASSSSSSVYSESYESYSPSPWGVKKGWNGYDLSPPGPPGPPRDPECDHDAKPPPKKDSKNVAAKSRMSSGESKISSRPSSPSSRVRHSYALTTSLNRCSASGLPGFLSGVREGGERVSDRWSLPRGSGADVTFAGSRSRAGAGIRGSNGECSRHVPG